MKFSIITTTFNAQTYLKETLESVANQTYGDVEHLIWDGGSSDETLSIASRYKTIIHEGKDRGIADGMNKGAAFASGDFLIHLHADDYLVHERVLAQIATTLKQHPNVLWLYGRAYIVNERGERVRLTPFEPFSPSRLRKYNFITHPATVISRKLFADVGGFCPKLKYCMDYDLWLRLAQKTTPLPLFAPLACFREHSGSLSTSEPSGVNDEVYQVRNRYIRSPLERWRSYRTWKKRSLR
ncbi:MAG: hypothetical protein S4CHLAM45_04590 [Chlamydiales bacterium]|nr:hypothetical protein [Chlamydiales bacterium]MCH9619311.1 hypothetical protein [Chlamydiales bacterium]MCH9622573.1 hypothetical protein [Chlamydiales bacterium]